MYNFWLYLILNFPSALSWVTAAVGLLVLAGCGDGRPTTAQRLIETEPSELLGVHSLGHEAVIFDSRPVVGEAAFAGWRLETDGAQAQVAEGVLVVETPSSGVLLQRRESLPAGTLHALELTITSRLPLSPTLSLEANGARARLDPERYREVRHDHSRVFRFDLRGTPCQRSACALSLKLEVPGAHTLKVNRIRGLRYRWSGSQRQSYSGARKVELQGEIRSALPVLPGAPVSRELWIAPDSKLHFAIGATGPLSEAVRLRLLAQEGNGQQRVLFETTVEPDTPEERAWERHTVELRSLGTGRARFTLEAEASSDFDPILGVPVWGTPTITSSLDEPRPNIVLISIDTLRADRILAAERTSKSPRIDAWARTQAVAFRRTVAPAPWTLPSHVTMLTGLDPTSHGVNHPFSTAPAELSTLAERLREAGYTTAAYTGGGWLHPSYGLLQGFDRYRFQSEAGLGDLELETHVAELEAELPLLARPFFLFLHSYAVHDFRDPRRLVAMGVSETADRSGLYDRAVAQMDRTLGGLLDALDGERLQGKTVVILTSDHGEALGGRDEGGELGHGSLNDGVLLVPLIIELPAGLRGHIVADQVRTADILPTILELAGLPAAADLDGQSLVPFLRSGSGETRVAVSYFSSPDHGLALRLGKRWRYTFNNSAWAVGEPREALYELAGEEGARHVPPAMHPHAVAFRELAVELLENRLPGLRLRIYNHSDKVFAGEIRGSMVSDRTVKSTDLAPSPFELAGPGVARFELPPGTESRLLFERVADGRLEIEGRRGTSQPADLALSLSGTSLPALFELREGVWSPPIGRGAGVGIELRGTHRRREEPAPHLLDLALQRQLRTLGYLD